MLFNTIIFCCNNFQLQPNALPLDGTSGHNGDHGDDEQYYQQLIGAVIALAGLLTAAITTVFLLLIKLK